MRPLPQVPVQKRCLPALPSEGSEESPPGSCSPPSGGAGGVGRLGRQGRDRFSIGRTASLPRAGVRFDTLHTGLCRRCFHTGVPTVPERAEFVGVLSAAGTLVGDRTRIGAGRFGAAHLAVLMLMGRLCGLRRRCGRNRGGGGGGRRGPPPAPQCFPSSWCRTVCR